MSQAVVLASNNRGKLAELSEILAPFRLIVHPLSEFTPLSAEETGTTFHANALLKARFAARASGLPAIADDSGIEVDALGGAPGVFSARFAGAGASDAANNEKLLTALNGISEHLRTARFRCVLAYVNDEKADPIYADGVWEGRVLEAARGSQGFGYDSLFLPNGERISAGEMTREAKNRVSHRAQALRELAAGLFVKV